MKEKIVEYLLAFYLSLSPSSSNNSTLLVLWIPLVQRGFFNTHPMAFILFTVNCRPTGGLVSTEARAVCEAGRDLKSFLTPVKTVFVAKSTWKLSNHFTENMMGQQRSISLNAWSRSTLDLASRISKFFFIRMNCFEPVHLPYKFSSPGMYVLVIISIESSIQMDVTAKKEELNFFFSDVQFLWKRSFYSSGIFRFNGNPFVFVLSILFLVIYVTRI